MPTVVAPTIFTSMKAVMSSVMGVWGTVTPVLPTVYGYNFATSGDYFSTPDSVANSITGDISFVVDCALDDWTPAAVNTLLSKDGISATTRSYAFNIQPTTGYPSLNFSTDGTTIISVTANAAPTVADGGRIHVGVQREASTGQVKFYTSPDHVTWTQLGTTQTGATGAIFDSTTQVHFGNLTSTSLSLAGKIYDVEIYSGLYFTGSATLKVDFDPADWTTGSTWTAVDTGEVWTINGNALTSTMALIPAALQTYAILNVDATQTNSVIDTQLFKNLVRTPADSSSQSAYDFCLGATTASSTDDPTGVSLGSTSGYFSFDGGDVFTLNGASGYTGSTQPTFVKNMHKTTTSGGWSVVLAINLPNTVTTNMIGTGNWGTINHWAMGIDGDTMIWIGTGQSSAGSENAVYSITDPTDSTWRVIGLAYTPSTQTYRVYNNGLEFTGTITGPVGNGDPSVAMFIGGFANLGKLKASAVLNKHLTLAEFNSIRSLWNTRHGGIY